MPYFCAGCPHNSSTKLPEGARAYAGIGCHYMVQWMDRETVGFTHMGGEGANWIGEAPFSTRDHVFQNLGDGTYNHSGVQAIRAALAAEHQHHLQDPLQRCRGDDRRPAQRWRAGPADRGELSAMGVKHVSVVYDEKEDVDLNAFPKGVKSRRAEMMDVQSAWRVEGVTAIVYIQTCAAEKRRRRKRGTFPRPRQARLHQHRCLRGLRRLRGAVELCGDRPRWKPSWAASGRSTSPPATRISVASRGSAPVS